MSTSLSTAEIPSATPRRYRSMFARLQSGRPLILGVLSVTLFLLTWELSVRREWLDSLFLPAPTEVFVAVYQVITSETFMHDLSVSAYEFGWGLGLSILVGGTLGILSGWYKPVDEFLKPLVIALNSTPNLALIPLLILLFGIGTLPKIILVMLGCVVVMLMNTAAGVQSVDPQLKRMAMSFEARDRHLIRTLVIPSVVPYFMAGVRICVGKAVVGVAVAEIFGSTAGLGNILIKAQSAFNMPVMFAAVIIMTVIGISLTQTAAWLERRILHWK